MIIGYGLSGCQKPVAGLWRDSPAHGEEPAPGLPGAAEVGNIYTGSVYMGLVSLLDFTRFVFTGFKDHKRQYA
jgi:3-hydroxy-3-methylglutaryl CoA synthase